MSIMMNQNEIGQSNRQIRRIDEREFYSTSRPPTFQGFERPPNEYVRTMETSTGEKVDIYREKEVHPYIPELSSFQKSKNFIESSTTVVPSPLSYPPPVYPKPNSSSFYQNNATPIYHSARVIKKSPPANIPVIRTPNVGNTSKSTVQTQNSGMFFTRTDSSLLTPMPVNKNNLNNEATTPVQVRRDISRGVSVDSGANSPPQHKDHDHHGGEKSVTIKKKTIRRKKINEKVNTLRDSYIDTIANSAFSKYPEISSDSEPEIVIPEEQIPRKTTKPVESAPILPPRPIEEPIQRNPTRPVESYPPPRIIEEPIQFTASKPVESSPVPRRPIEEPFVSKPTRPVYEEPFKEEQTTKDQSKLPFENLDRYDDVSNQTSYIEEKQKPPLSTYSARKENMRTQQMIQKEKTPSVRAMPSERRTNETTEEVETITLQPIGKGVQDLASGTTMSRPVSRAQTPRVTDTSNTMKSTQYFREENRQQNLLAPNMYNTMPSAHRMNKVQSARNINQINDSSMTEQRQFFANSPRPRVAPAGYSQTMRTTSASGGYIPPTQTVSSSWHTRNENYRTGDNNFSYSEQAVTLQNVLACEDIWYQPNYDRDQAIQAIKDKNPGSFIIRNSSTYVGAYGLALKVHSVPQNAARSNDLKSDLVRHFLIETVEDVNGSGVRLKDLINEPVFPSLAHLVHAHCYAQMGLPCQLILPVLIGRDLVDTNSVLQHSTAAAAASGMQTTTYEYETRQHEQFGGESSATATATANNYQQQQSQQQQQQHQSQQYQQKSLIQRSISNPGVNFVATNHPNPLHRNLVLKALYLGKVDVDRLNGDKAIENAVSKVISKKSLKTTTVEVELDSTAGITITDKLQKLFYTRQFPAQHVLYANMDPGNREFTAEILKTNGINRGKIVGIVIRKQRMMMRENAVHLFCEIDNMNDLNQIIMFINENYVRRV